LRLERNGTALMWRNSVLSVRWRDCYL